ncbi:MAG: caspase family protein [Bacteroidia bacterium]|nr:caspase family protein [Bacteroidia bacterium]
MPRTKKPKLYALIVGVNDYESPKIRDLRGCVDDASRIKAYLEEDFVGRNFAANPSISLLTDEKATKKAIIEGFEKKLSKAKKGDSVIFYFAGHGLREKTDIEVFTEDEFDDHIAAILCHDSNPFEHKNDPSVASISDKELRFLIHQLEKKTGAHILTVFDCCHSGENTRNMQATGGAPEASRQLERNPLPARSQKGFYFGGKEKQILGATKKNLNLASVLPEGPHVQLAACKEVELAMETPPNASVRKGVFTTTLLDVLHQFKGDINYDDLHLRVLNRMSTYKQTNDAQTPQLYISTDDPNQRYKTFLTNAASDKTLTCGVVVGGQEDVEKEWRITAGALQAIPIDQKKVPTEVLVKSTKNRRTKWKAGIKKVYPGYSVIDFTDKEPPANDATLFAEIEGVGIDPLGIYLGGSDEEMKKLVAKELKKHIKTADIKYYELLKKEDAANYTVHIEGGLISISLPFQPKKPVVEGIMALNKQKKFTPKSVEVLDAYLDQMSQWHFLRKLEYKEKHDLSTLTDKDKTMYPVELRMYQYDRNKASEKRLFPNKNGTFTFDLTHKKESRNFRMEVINHSENDYYCSVLYLPNNYEVFTKAMNSPQLMLAPEQVLASRGSKKENGKRYITLSLAGKEDQFVHDFNLSGVSYFLKLIISKTPFNVDSLAMKGLPKPKASRSLNFGDDEDSFDYDPEIPDIQWEVHTFELYIVNPA